MRIWIESAVRRLLNTKMPTEDVVGLPAQRQVGGVYVLPPWGMALNQKGFFFFFYSTDCLEVGFPGDNIVWTLNQLVLFKQTPPHGQDFSPFAKGTTPSGFLTGPSISAGDESWGRGSGSRAEDGGGCWSWAGSSQVTGLASPAILLRKASVLLF